MTTDTSERVYQDAVLEGKEILKQIDAAERGQLRLGELAAKLETVYGDRTLAKFAVDLGIAKCTLARYRDVYRAWRDISAPGRESVSYAVLRELATHPDREEIIRKDPNITKREAHDQMRKLKGTAKEKQEQEEEWLKHNHKWFKDLVALANEASRMADVTDQCTSEQLDNLLQAVDPDLLMYVRGAGKRLVALADNLEQLLEEEEAAEQAEQAEQEHSAPIERAHPEAIVHVGA